MLQDELRILDGRAFRYKSYLCFTVCGIAFLKVSRFDRDEHPVQGNGDARKRDARSDGLDPELKRDFIDGSKHAHMSEGSNAYAIVDFGHHDLIHQDKLIIAQPELCPSTSVESGELERRFKLADEVTILTLSGGTRTFALSTTFGGFIATAGIIGLVGGLLIGWKAVCGGYS